MGEEKETLISAVKCVRMVGQHSFSMAMDIRSGPQKLESVDLRAVRTCLSVTKLKEKAQSGLEGRRCMLSTSSRSIGFKGGWRFVTVEK